MTISQDATFFVHLIVPNSNLLCDLCFSFAQQESFQISSFLKQKFQATGEIMFSHLYCKNSVFLPREDRCSGTEQWQTNNSTRPHCETLQHPILPLSFWAQKISNLDFPLVLRFGSSNSRSFLSLLRAHQ